MIREITGFSASLGRVSIWETALSTADKAACISVPDLYSTTSAFDFKSTAAPRSGTLTLRSGVDKITGMMLGYDAKDGFLWRLPAIAGEMRIDGADVRKLSFAAIGMV